MPKDCIEEAVATAVACDFDPEQTANFIIGELDDHGFAIVRSAENKRLREALGKIKTAGSKGIGNPGWLATWELALIAETALEGKECE